MSDGWYLLRDGQALGPSSFQELRAMARLQWIVPDDLLRDDTGVVWRAGELAWLFREEAPPTAVPARSRRRRRIIGRGLSVLIAVLLLMLAAPFVLTAIVRAYPNRTVHHTVPPVPPEAKYRMYADEVVGFVAGALDYGQRLLDEEAVFERGLAEVELPDPLWEPAFRNVRPSGYLWSLRHAADEDVSGRLLDMRDDGPRKTLLFRFVTDTVEYVGVTAEIGADGLVRGVDYRSWLTGGSASEGLRELAETFLTRFADGEADGEIDGEIDSETGGEGGASRGEWVSEVLRIGGLMRDIGDANDDRRYDDALAGYERLPEPFRRQRAVQAARFRAAARSQSPDAFRETFADIRRILGEGPEFDLMYCYGHYYCGEFEPALRRCESLRRQTGDPFLKSFEAALQQELGRPEAALVLAREATDDVPEVVNTWWTRFVVESKQEDFTAALRTLQEVVGRFSEYDPESFSRSEDFRAFRESPQFFLWEAWLDGRDEPSDSLAPL